MKNPKTAGLLSFFCIAFISWLSYQQLNTPEPALPGYATDSYSAYRSIEHLKIIAKEPHSGGTVAHRKVRNYIYDVCKRNGLNVKVYNDTGLRTFGSTTIAGDVFNILAKLPGTNSSKAILVMAHYDSQPNTPGAADDGSGVASMLETIELLSKRNLKNDIYFLFTDLEEVGLLGAEAFVNSNNELNEVGMILNYEARGNSGASFTFETSAENGWIVKEFNQAVNKPLANSLAYEIYKLMPNDSDFTMFRDTQISGLNTAFIDGYSYYHSAADTPQNINLESLQHQGDLMLQMITHFGQLDLTNTKSEDAIFFSMFNWMVIYPAYLDWPLIVLIIGLFITILIINLRQEKITISNLFKGSLIYLLVIVLAMLLVWLLNLLVISFNPHYTNFYSSNFYNATVYLWLIIGACLISYNLINQSLLKSISTNSRLLGGLLIHAILILVLKRFVPTGAFILYIPIVPTLLIVLYESFNKEMSSILRSVLPTVLPTVLPLLLWAPFIYFLFVVFSHSLPFASAFFVVLLFPYLGYFRSYFVHVSPNLLTYIGIILMLFGFFWGQVTSTYDQKQPLQTQLSYALNLDDNKAFWVSSQKYKDEFNGKYIQSNEKQTLSEIYPNSSRMYWKDNAPILDVQTAEFIVLSDTVINGFREVNLNIKPDQKTTYFTLFLPTDAYYSKVNERIISESTSKNLWYYAPSTQGCNVTIVTNSKETIDMTFIESKLKIAPSLLTFPLPDDYIYGTGRLSNNMLIKKTVSL